MIKKLLLILLLTFGVFAIESDDNDKPEKFALVFKNTARYKDVYIQEGLSKEQVFDEMSKDVAYALKKMNLFASGLTPVKNIISLRDELGDVLSKKLYLDNSSYYSIKKATSSLNAKMSELEKVTAMYNYASVKFYQIATGKPSDVDLEHVQFLSLALSRRNPIISDSDLEYIYMHILKYLYNQCNEKRFEIFKLFEKDMPALHQFVGEKFSVESINILKDFHTAVANKFKKLIFKN